MTTTTDTPKKPAMPFVRKIEMRTLGLADRVRDYRNKTAKFDSEEVAKHLQTADVALRAACEAMAKLPDDAGYVKAGSSVKAALEIGATVEIRESRRKHYEGILADGDMVGLVVTKVSQTKVVAETTTGTRLVLSRGHVAIQEVAAKPAKDEETEAVAAEA